MDHLRFSGLPAAEQEAALEAILRADPVIWPAIELARALDLPDWMIVSGAIYNTVWNHLTGKPAGHGIRDVDLFYHDASDLSWEAEDRIIRAGAEHFSGLSLPVEIRNQARVHLWYTQRFGGVVPAFTSSANALPYFAAETHAVGVRLEADDSLTISAPFGLDHIFSFRMVPNRATDNRRTHAEKSARAKAFWPDLTVEDW
ncbi:MAG: nucleotidyltransferase family protein [Pseudomonadota bacterium]